MRLQEHKDLLWRRVWLPWIHVLRPRPGASLCRVSQEMWMKSLIFMWEKKKLMFLFKLAREKPKVVKGSNEANDGPEAKKPKVDPNETTMVKKVGLI